MHKYVYLDIHNNLYTYYNGMLYDLDMNLSIETLSHFPEYDLQIFSYEHKFSKI